MERFARLFARIDGTTKTNAKVEALVDYLKDAPEKDKVWAIAIMTGRRPKRPMTTTKLRAWAAETAGISEWLFEDSYHIAGDLAETIALLAHRREFAPKSDRSLTDFVELIQSMKGMEEAEQKELVQRTWSELDFHACFVFIKLLTGGFRMGVSSKLMTRAVAKAVEQEENVVAHKLMGDWDPNKITYQELIFETRPENIASKPYPFYLAYPIQESKDPITDYSDWLIEWKWDGIRGQLIVREDHHYVWTRGEELVTHSYPEFAELKNDIPNGTVLDGEILAMKDGVPMDFKALQKRLGRKRITPKLLAEIPVVIVAYDVLEYGGKDIRSKSMIERRKILEEIARNCGSENIILSPLVQEVEIMKLEALLGSARERGCEGFMLKRKNSMYEVGRKKGNWWKWKVEPFTIDAVLTFAMRGHGRRANMYTDYTFGLWNNGELVTFAKAYSGLTDDEIREVDSFVKNNTLERFGPVRQVEPQLVFEIAFEGIAASSRHKSGVAVRFPRIARWRHDKDASEANNLDDIHGLLNPINVSLP
jgi:DNA ligase-1